MTSRPPISTRRSEPTAHLWLRTLQWRPLAWTMAGTTTWVVVASAPALPGRIALAGSVIATTTGFLVEDAATTTLSAAPTSLSSRRRQRALVALGTVTGWWMAALAWSLTRGADRPPAEMGLQLAALVGVALAVSAIASKVGDLEGGGVAGLVLALAFYASSLLPPHVPFRLLPDPTTTAAIRQNAIVFATTVVILAATSRDPASRRP